MARERELAKVSIKKEDVDLIVSTIYYYLCRVIKNKKNDFCYLIFLGSRNGDIKNHCWKIIKRTSGKFS